MSKTSDDAGKVWPWIWLIVAFVIIIWSLFLLEWFPWWITEERGEFGDSFGVVNALFSGLAFAGVIWAIILQKKELALQREELANTREEIKGQKEQLEAQNQTLQKQNFESSFFQLLGLYNDIVNSMAVQRNSRELSGRECFGFMLREFRDIFKKEDERFWKDELIFWDGWYKEWPEARRGFINHKYDRTYAISIGI